MGERARIDKPFHWSDEKDRWLIRQRGVSFLEIAQAIAENLLDVRVNRSRGRRHQRVFIVEIRGYPWAIPFEETQDAIVLKTAFPSRKLKNEFQRKS